MRGNINSLMAQAAKMQQNLQRLQSELANVEVTGEAGSGAVKVTMTCKYGFERTCHIGQFRGECQLHISQTHISPVGYVTIF